MRLDAGHDGHGQVRLVRRTNFKSKATTIVLSREGYSMNALLVQELDTKRGLLAALCAKHGVTSLDIFGSGTRDDWQPARSDIDFLVVFDRHSDRGIADRYFGLAEDLEALFGRPVDLVTERSIRNPYFRQAVESSRRSVYAG